MSIKNPNKIFSSNTIFPKFSQKMLTITSPSSLQALKISSPLLNPTKTHKINTNIYPKPKQSHPKFITFANNNNINKNPEEKETKENDPDKNERPRFNLKWVDLVLDPDPDNIVAVGLTGVLAWASVQVLGQLFFISLAILTAALKYSFIAALLVFILITLL